jgi:xanthine dehydrogenase accessory factor
MRLLRTGESTLLRITPTDEGTAQAPATEGQVTVANPCLSGGTLDIFLEAMLPPVLVHVYGLGPIARALVDLGAALGYEVRAAEPTVALPVDLGAVVVASHGRDEQDVLASAVRAGVPYVGLVASRRRGAAVLAELTLTAEQAAAVHTPAGLDIGGRTAGEVALSIYAELVAERPRQPKPPALVLPEPVSEALDPVCGMTVAITPVTLSAEIDGRRVYFCGPGCQSAFADLSNHQPR